MEPTLRRLFVDDHHIADMSGLTRTMNRPVKHGGNPVVRPDRPWEEHSVSAKNSVVYDPKDGKYKLWYRIHNSCYAESRDGIEWMKPSLGMAEFGGSFATNRLGRDVFQIVYDEEQEELGNHPYLSVNWNHERGNYLISSPDGLHWDDGVNIDIPKAGDTFICTKAVRGLTGHSDSGLPGSPAGERLRLPRYIGAVRWCEPVGRFDGSHVFRPTRRVQALVTSEHMARWDNPVRILTPDSLDDEIAHERIEAAVADGTLVHDIREDRRCEFYTILIFPYEDMYFGLLMVFYPSYDFNRIGKNNQAGPAEIQLVASRDLYNWIRVGDRKPFIAKGSAGQFDQGMACYISSPVVAGDTLRFYYTGTVITHAGQRDEKYTRSLMQQIERGSLPGMHSVGLATLRRDGFVSLDAGNEGGHVVTKAFRWPESGRLHMNADAAAGEICVAVLQPDGTPYTGCEQSLKLEGDMTGAAVRWEAESGNDLHVRGDLYTHGTEREAPSASAGDDDRLKPGRMARLKIYARNAKLYSYWFA